MMFSGLMSRWTIFWRGQQPARRQSVCQSAPPPSRAGLRDSWPGDGVAACRRETHDDVGQVAVGQDVAAQHAGDAGMLRHVGRDGFQTEAGQDLRILRQPWMQHLDGDATAELPMLGLVHHAHPATTKLAEDAVVLNLLRLFHRAYGRAWGAYRRHILGHSIAGGRAGTAPFFDVLPSPASGSL